MKTGPCLDLLPGEVRRHLSASEQDRQIGGPERSYNSSDPMLSKECLVEYRDSGCNSQLLQIGTEWVGGCLTDSWVSVCFSLIHTTRLCLILSCLAKKKGPALPPHYELKPYFLLWQNPNSWGRGALREGLSRSLPQTQALGQLILAMSVPSFVSEQAGAAIPQEQGLT